jgi:GNAT superfamily N-acetyltransferase
MEPLIRPARQDDVAVIADWTRDTFEWGDYIADVLPDWIGEPNSAVLVAEVDGTAVGVSRCLMMSPVEAWAQGGRVHPDHRRRGIGHSIMLALLDWAHAQGARVVRGMVEDWNEIATRQLLRLDYRQTGRWVRAGRGVGENSPVPEGNGGRRVPAAEGLRPAHSSEASAAMMSWWGGDLERASRGLLPIDTWRMRRLAPDDLVEAARRRALLSGRPGWAVGEVEEDGYEVSWLSTEDGDANAMLRALIDRAAAAGTEEIRVMFPAVDWLVTALKRRSFELFPLTIYARSL